VQERDIYEIDGLLDLADTMSLALRPGFSHLKIPQWPPQPPADLVGREGNIWEQIQEGDALLVHPYEKFDPVVELVEQAAEDPDVLAVKQTLYRTSGDSPIIKALERAAENGKQVAVLVELKARFDEARNVNWARRLEDAGCHVIYGIAGYKTHAKLLLIIRREPHGVRRYVHLSTGNYNDKTAKLYSDIGMMTCDRDLATDTAAFFNLLTGYSQEVPWRKLAISPRGIRRRCEEMIEREAEMATEDQPGLIMAKFNSLEDPGIIRALYRASRAGVKIFLNVRGICCLRPGLEGISENIQVVSIIDRYLEHARIFYFRNGGREEFYLSSADWMVRNLNRRLEALFPVQDPDLQERLRGMLHTYFSDNTRAWQGLPDGTYQRVPTGDPQVRAQEALYRMAEQAARRPEQARLQFKPLSRPE
jgi:polyphosphate kinase